MSLQDLAVKILSKPCPHPVRLVAVDGRAGSGKSTLAERLAEALGNAPVFPLDDFGSYVDIISRWPQFEEQVLVPLFQGRDARYQARDWEGDYAGNSFKDWKDLPFAKTVILEGVTSSRSALADRLAFSIWVDAPQEVRLQRGLDRDKGIPGIEELWRNFQAMEDRFFAEDDCRGRADVVVDGTKTY